MGGASSDAATALRGIAALHNVTANLQEIARQLGADVPFFLTGGTAIGEQRGDQPEAAQSAALVLIKRAEKDFDDRAAMHQTQLKNKRNKQGSAA